MKLFVIFLGTFLGIVLTLSLIFLVFFYHIRKKARKMGLGNININDLMKQVSNLKNVSDNNYNDC